MNLGFNFDEGIGDFDSLMILDSPNDLFIDSLGSPMDRDGRFSHHRPHRLFEGVIDLPIGHTNGQPGGDTNGHPAHS